MANRWEAWKTVRIASAGGGSRAVGAAASFAFYIIGVPRCGGTTLDACLDVIAELGQGGGAELVFDVHEAEGFADDFAGGAVEAGGDLLADHWLQVGGLG